eukprot:GHRQ01002382.1.p1 GENE.GHRQ01002382.1~~GHRQ01002382.1.p1  ORF type:complete len:155 (-),score=21.19 GHRQ01002382.1:258-722(-)
MALCIHSRACVALRSTEARRVSVRPVVVRSGVKDAADNVAEGFVQIFSKPQDNDVKWASNDFKGKISHHGAGKPFKDGFSAPKPTKATPVTNSQNTQQEAPQGEEEDYLGEAVQNLVSHNFTGDENVPPETTGSSGWKGDIHDRKSDGFHTRKI